MLKKQDEIINELNNSKEIKRFKELEKSIKNNKKYNELINNFNKNKNEYEKNDTLNKEIINLRKELFKIEEVREYAKIESEIRLFAKQTSDIISSVIKNTTC